MKDTAYTTLALPAHTDTTYFTDPAGLQMFHLLSHTAGSGGASLLVDGFKAARVLKEKDPYAYEILTKVGITCHASGNKGITITPGKKYPVLNHGDIIDETGQYPLMQVRWNNDDRGSIDLGEARGTGSKPSITAESWYYAARLWNSILQSKDMEYWSQLKPGRPISKS